MNYHHSKFSVNKNIAIMGKVIDLLRTEGLKMESPYDVENWVAEYGENHSNLFATGKFVSGDDE